MKNSTTGSVLFNFNAPEDLPSPLPTGLGYLQTMGSGAVRGTKDVSRRMPPPPLAALEDWQIDIIDGWAVNPLP